MRKVLAGVFVATMMAGGIAGASRNGTGPGTPNPPSCTARALADHRVGNQRCDRNFTGEARKECRKEVHLDYIRAMVRCALSPTIIGGGSMMY